jgi:hypothetical protein
MKFLAIFIGQWLKFLPCLQKSIQHCVLRKPLLLPVTTCYYLLLPTT